MALIVGTALSEYFWASNQGDTIRAGDGNDVIWAGNGSDLLLGENGNDSIMGGRGADTIIGGAGNDHISDFAAGDDQLFGGDGDDWVAVSHIDGTGPGPSNVILDGGAGRDDISVLSLGRKVFATLTGGSGDDRLGVVGDVAAIIDAGDGQDEVVFSGSSEARVTLGSDQDLLRLGQASTTTGVVTIADFVTGWEGDRTQIYSFFLTLTDNRDVYWNPFATGNARLVQQGGDVLLQARAANDQSFQTVIRFENQLVSNFTATSLNGFGPNDAFRSSPSILGTSGADIINGGDIEDHIQGLGGDDILRGYAGNDTLLGGEGNDDLSGARGDDFLEGGSGNDELRGDEGSDTLWGGDGHDRVFGDDGFDQINGNMGNDTASGGEGGDWVVGGRDNDLLNGDNGDDVVYGNLGNDTCYGGQGADWVRGGQGDDLLDGGAGDDWMAGDRGSDTLTGGEGADKFYFFVGAGLDRIMDFNSAAGDRVLLELGTKYSLSYTSVGAVIDLGGGDQLILVGATSGTIGEWLTFS